MSIDLIFRSGLPQPPYNQIDLVFLNPVYVTEGTAGLSPFLWQPRLSAAPGGGAGLVPTRFNRLRLGFTGAVTHTGIDLVFKARTTTPAYNAIDLVFNANKAEVVGFPALLTGGFQLLHPRFCAVAGMAAALSPLTPRQPFWPFPGLGLSAYRAITAPVGLGNINRPLSGWGVPPSTVGPCCSHRDRWPVSTTAWHTQACAVRAGTRQIHPERWLSAPPATLAVTGPVAFATLPPHAPVTQVVWRAGPPRPQTGSIRFQAALSRLTRADAMVWGRSDLVGSAADAAFRSLSAALARTTARFGHGATLLLRAVVRWHGVGLRPEPVKLVWRNGRFPTEGLRHYPLPPLPPDLPRRLGIGIELLFCEPHQSLSLVFGKLRHPLISRRYVPILRVYRMHDTAYLIRLSDGLELNPTSMSVSTNVDSTVWTLNATLPTAAALTLFAPDSEGSIELKAIFNGHEFDFLVSEPGADETTSADGAPNESASVYGKSLTAYYDAPRALPGTWTNATERLASQLARDILPVDVALTWDAQDWAVPEGVFSCAGTPMVALGVLATAAAGHLLSSKTGIGFTVAPRWPVKPWGWGAVSPYALIPRTYATALQTKWVTEDPLYNAVYVVGDRSGVLVHVKRLGTAGDRLAPQVHNPLACHADIAQQLGIAAIANSGPRRLVTMEFPVAAELGILPLSAIIAIADLNETWKGIVRSVTIQARLQQDAAHVTQTVLIERPPQ